MPNYPNIVSSKHGKSYYVGYDASGYAWRILGESGAWRAWSHHTAVKEPAFTARTLREMSQRLARITSYEPE